MYELGGRTAYAGCYACAGANCSARNHDGSGTNWRTKCHRASCASADAGYGSGKSKHDAADKYDRPTDSHYDQSGGRGNRSHAPDANESQYPSNNTGSGNSRQYAADNACSGAGSGERALCNSTGKHATNEFHRESAPEQSGCESGHS